MILVHGNGSTEISRPTGIGCQIRLCSPLTVQTTWHCAGGVECTAHRHPTDQGGPKLMSDHNPPMKKSASSDLDTRHAMGVDSKSELNLDLAC